MVDTVFPRISALLEFRLKGGALIGRIAFHRGGAYQVFFSTTTRECLVVPGMFTAFTKSAPIGQELNE